MLKWIETTGKTEEEAIAAALRQLGMDRDDVSVEVLERAKSGFLGIGSVPAKVKVTYEAPDEPEEAAVPEPPSLEPAVPVMEEISDPVEEITAAPAEAVEEADDEKAQAIRTFLTGLLAHMDIEARPSISRTEEGNYKVVLEGENLGALIGRRGETLDAIQQLTSYSINRGASHRVRVYLDAESYRARREEALVRLANKMAGKAVKYRKNMILEPMNAYERHVIHTALQDVPDVSTYSMGNEPNRRTVVAYTPGENR
ncbi:MAG: protein jag [Oscillospiraceae bacterium]|nr:protein jag [Oscillospiraceae bacterium]